MKTFNCLQDEGEDEEDDDDTTKTTIQLLETINH